MCIFDNVKDLHDLITWPAISVVGGAFAYGAVE